MADTFSINPGEAVTAATNNQPGLARLTGAPSGVDAGVTGFDSSTTKALLQLGSDILAPKIKEAAQAQFMEGVQLAATGEAIGDIVADRPWYSEIFGPSSAVQGARAYTVAQKVAKFGAEMEAKMPILAQQGPEAINEQLGTLRDQVMTGDDTADMAITAQIVDQMAPLYKRHAKEHYAYLQNKASDAQVDAWSSLGAGYQQRAAAAAKGDGMVSQEDVAADAARLLGNMNPFADQPDSSYDRNVARFLESSATGGNFHVVKLFKDNGLYDKLPPDMRASLDRTFRAAGAQTLAQATPQFFMDMAMFVNDTAQDPRNIAERAAAINARASAVTGVPLDMAQIIPNSTVDQIAGRVLVAQAAANKSAEEKLGEEQQKIAIAQSFLAVKDGIALCKATKVCAEGYGERAAIQQWAQLPPQGRAELLNNHPTETFAGLQSRFSGVMNGKEDSPGVQATAQMWASMTDGTKQRYFSADENKFLSKYTAMVAAEETPASAYVAAKVVTPLSKTYLDKADKNDMANAIRAQAEDSNENFFGWNQVPEGQMRVFESVLGEQVKQRTFGDVASSARAAMGEANAQQRVVRIGKYAVLGVDPAQPRLETLLGGKVGFQAAGGAFTSIVEEGVKAVGGDDPESAVVIRLPDIGGVAQWMVQTQTAEGMPRSFRLNSDMLVERGRAAAAAPSAPQSLNRAPTGPVGPFGGAVPSRP